MPPVHIAPRVALPTGRIQFYSDFFLSGELQHDAAYNHYTSDEKILPNLWLHEEHHITPSEKSSSILELLLEDSLQGDSVGRKLDNTLVQLIECHLVSEKGPTELRFVVDEGNLGDRIRLSSYPHKRHNIQVSTST